ncbi:hypothetical protein CNMCM5623_006945 [Aspergillus felis]|uniref:Uncharacterized protein n=1 Tax=Aspergillus felis TaxID=1287682 RepID=A0A8H6QIQ3_9EURO|nr:hypothetical protein CNMCM5623_006945 [Aspergillus felis]
MQRRRRRRTPRRQKRQNLRLPIDTNSRIPLTRIPILILDADGAPRRRITLDAHNFQRPIRRPADPADGLAAGAPAAGDDFCAVGENAGGGFCFGGCFGGAGGPGALEGEDPVYFVLLIRVSEGCQ